jgi:hypothetical protein
MQADVRMRSTDKVSNWIIDLGAVFAAIGYSSKDKKTRVCTQMSSPQHETCHDSLCMKSFVIRVLKQSIRIPWYFELILDRDLTIPRKQFELAAVVKFEQLKSSMINCRNFTSGRGMGCWQPIYTLLQSRTRWGMREGALRNGCGAGYSIIDVCMP